MPQKSSNPPPYSYRDRRSRLVHYLPAFAFSANSFPRLYQLNPAKAAFLTRLLAPGLDLQRQIAITCPPSMRNPTRDQVGGSNGTRTSDDSCAARNNVKDNFKPIIIRTTTEGSSKVETYNFTQATQPTHGVEGERLFQQIAKVENREGEREGKELVDGMSASQQALELRKARGDHFRDEMRSKLPGRNRMGEQG